MFSQTETLQKKTPLLALTAIAMTALTFGAFAAPALASHGDANNDGYISVAEGVPFYGGIQSSLTTSGDATADSALALDRFPTANANGSYTYSRTLNLSDAKIADLTNGHIVVHGIDIDGSGEYDGEKESSIAPGVPFEATVPAACGVLEANGDHYSADLDELNSSDVDGDVEVTIDGNQVTINMNVTGTSANLPHAQHIHIGGSNDCPPNTVGVDQENKHNYSDKFEKFQVRFEAQQERFQNRFENRREKFQNRFEAQQENFQDRFEKRKVRFFDWSLD